MKPIFLLAFVTVVTTVTLSCSGVQSGGRAGGFWCLQASKDRYSVAQCFRTQSECELNRDEYIVGGGTSENPCHTMPKAYCFIVDDRLERCWESEQECTSRRDSFVARNPQNTFGECRLRIGG